MNDQRLSRNINYFRAERISTFFPLFVMVVFTFQSNGVLNLHTGKKHTAYKIAVLYQ